MIKIKPIAAAVALVSSAVLAGATQAATLVIQDGQLMGADGVKIGESYYNVSFVDAACTAIFSGCNSVDDFFFTTQADAMAASQALLDQVLIDTAAGNFDTSPALTNGISMTTGTVFTIFGFKPSDSNMVFVARALNKAGVDNDGVYAPSQNMRTTNTSVQPGIVYAVWSEGEAPTATVPLPAGAWLLLSGIGGFGLLRKARRAA